jgi:hypothetical protein
VLELLPALFFSTTGLREHMSRQSMLSRWLTAHLRYSLSRSLRDELELLREMSEAIELNLLNSGRSNITDPSMSHELGVLLDQSFEYE